MGKKNQGGESVKVLCRFRPMNEIEKKKRSNSSIDITSETSVLLHGDFGKQKFVFDRIFDTHTDQETLYNDVGKKVVDDLFKGFNGTIFCYGQTGSGKTYTMMGPNEDNTGYCDDPELKGLIPRIVESIFSTLENMDETTEFTIQVSYIEIYMEKLRDLLNTHTEDILKIREEKGKGGRGIYVENAVSRYCGSVEEVFEYMREGGAHREVGSHSMNEGSSRSHCVFIIKMASKDLVKGETRNGKLYLVDLAGSESVKKTEASGKLLKEAQKINYSLSVLGMVIKSLTDGKSTHVPYRDSKLTRMLQESLGGNSKTFLIINCSPASYNQSETLSTLRFGKCAKNIKNKAKVNKEMDKKALRALLERAQLKIKEQEWKISDFERRLSSTTRGTAIEKKKEAEEDDINKSPYVQELMKRIEGFETEIQEQKELISILDESREVLRENLVETNGLLHDRTVFCKEIEGDLEKMKGVKDENLFLENKVRAIEARVEKLEFEGNEAQITIDALQGKLKEAQKKKLDIESRTKIVGLGEEEVLESTIKKIESLPFNNSSNRGSKAVPKKRERRRSSQTKVKLFDKKEYMKQRARRRKRRARSNSVVELKSDGTGGGGGGMIAAAFSINNSSFLSTEREDGGVEKKRGWVEKSDVIEEAEEEIEESGEVEVEQKKEEKTQESSDAVVEEKKILEVHVEETAGDDEVILKKDVENRGDSEEAEEPKESTSVAPQLGSGDDSLDIEVYRELVAENERLSRSLEEMRKNIHITRKNSKKVKQHLEKQKYALMTELRDRCNKVVELQMYLDELQEKYKHVMYLAEKDNCSKRLMVVEKRMRKAETTCRGLELNNSSMKLKMRMMKNKLKIRGDRIMSLEKSLERAIEDNARLTQRHIQEKADVTKLSEKQKEEIKRLKASIVELNRQLMRRPPPKLVKKLRGGKSRMMRRRNSVAILSLPKAFPANKNPVSSRLFQRRSTIAIGHAGAVPQEGMVSKRKRKSNPEQCHQTAIEILSSSGRRKSHSAKVFTKDSRRKKSLTFMDKINLLMNNSKKKNPRVFAIKHMLHGIKDSKSDDNSGWDF